MTAEFGHGRTIGFGARQGPPGVDVVSQVMPPVLSVP
jgi:hypothetical protein